MKQAKRPTVKSLENGKILATLVKNFMEDKTSDNFAGVLTCLRDSKVWIGLKKPVDAHLNVLSLDARRKAAPALLQTKKGRKFFPIYSMTAQIPPDYAKNYQFKQLPMLEAIDLVEGLEDVNLIVVNPFTHNLVLTSKELEIIKKIPSQLVDEEEQQ